MPEVAEAPLDEDWIFSAKLGWCLDGNHDKCKRAIRHRIVVERDGGGKVMKRSKWVVFCPCECHPAPEEFKKCLECGATDQPLTDMLGCVDVEACVARVHDKAMARITTLGLDFVPRPTVTRARATRSRAPTVPQLCHCGCGGMTKGGKFIPGHDAKLKGILKREDTLEAWAERLARGWGGDLDVFVEEDQEDIRALSKEAGFVERRVEERTAEHGTATATG